MIMIAAFIVIILGLLEMISLEISSLKEDVNKIKEQLKDEELLC